MEQYVLEASSDRLPVSSIIQKFGADVLPTELELIASNFPFLNNFDIENPQIIFPLTSNPLTQVHLLGHPIISGFSIGPTILTIIKHGNGVDLVQGFKLESVNLADLLGKILPPLKNLLRANVFLNQDIDAAILICPETLPAVDLYLKDFRDFVVQKGISIKATIPVPEQCSVDPFCAVFRALLGDVSITLQGTIINPSLSSLSAIISDDISVGSALTISNPRVEVTLGASTEIGIAGTVSLTNPALTFICRIAVRPLPLLTQVVLEMSMTGCWQDPFGLPYVAICNLLSSFAIMPGVLIPSGIEYGGEVRIGNDDCGTVITALGYIGIDRISPQENYLYTEVQGELTIASLLDAFCVSGINLPAPLASTGFPNGFLVSFALFEKVLSHIELTIPPGFRFSGTLNILGLSLHADLTIGIPDGINMTVVLPAINVGNGLLVMSASRSNRGQGPTLQAEISPRGVNMQANGFLSVLGISLETNLSITNSGYSFNIEGRMLNLFQAELTIRAPYGNLLSAQYEIRGSFKSDFFSRIENSIISVAERVADEANAIVDGLQRDVENARRIFGEADRALQSAQEEFNRAQSVFYNGVREVDRLRRQLDSVCHIRSCGNVLCVGCFSGTRCCGRAWGNCVCWLPRWKGCCTRIPDPICEAENLACRALKAPIDTLLVGAREAVRTSGYTLDIAREALQVARHAVRTAESSVDIAVAALEVAQATYQIGLQAAELVVRLGSPSRLVSIKEITFDTSLAVANTGRFTAQLRGCLAGNNVNIGVNINLHSITDIAKELADRIVDGLSELF